MEITSTHANAHLARLKEANPVCRVSVLSQDWGTSSTERPLSTVAATTPVSAPSEVSACPSWTLRQGWPKTTATSGWNSATDSLVGGTAVGTGWRGFSMQTGRKAGTIHSYSFLHGQKQPGAFCFLDEKDEVCVFQFNDGWTDRTE